MLIADFTYKGWELVNFGPLKLLGQSPGIELINLSCSAQIDHIRWSHFVRIGKTLSGGEIRLGGCGHMTLVYDSFLLSDTVSSQLKELMAKTRYEAADQVVADGLWLASSS